MRSIRLYAGTRKGLFVLRSDASRCKWEIEGPLLPGLSVQHAVEDPRDPSRAYVAASHMVWGPRLVRSADGGCTWEESVEGIAFGPEREEAVKSVWTVRPGV